MFRRLVCEFIRNFWKITFDKPMAGIGCPPVAFDPIQNRSSHTRDGCRNGSDAK